jgi:single-strand DNA-binding protein
MNTTITVAGNCTRDPELRYTPSGTAVASIDIAITPRRRNGETGAFENGETTFLNLSAFGPIAVNVAESLRRGDRMLAVGRLVERSFTATRGERAGQEIRRHEMVVDEIGTSLRFATAKAVKSQRTEQEQGDEVV